MKAKQVLIFIIAVFVLLGLSWAIAPAGTVEAGPLELRFPSYRRSVAEASEKKVDVDSVINSVKARFTLHDDTLSFYRNFFYENPDRIYLPGDDYRFFDPVFRKFENAAKYGQMCRVAHYGDSQIELDRISSQLRDSLQNRFGGIGTGMFPVIGNVPSASIQRAASGDFVQYTMYGDSTTMRAPHSRYGVMAQVVQMTGGGTVNLRASASRSASNRVKTFSSISILYGRASKGFSVKAVSDTLKAEPITATGENGTTLVTLSFDKPVAKARVTFTGNAEIYGMSADGDSGVAVDNIPLRGCSGTIFTRINKDAVREGMALDGTALIIMQFGGNIMPVASSSAKIASYGERIAEQIRYFHDVAPQAKILFIGPSDMGKSVGGKIVTWPRLPEVVDTLKANALRNDAAYWDLFHMMGGENSMVRWVKHSPAWAGADYVHFTPAGATLVGETFARSLLTYYDFYCLRKTVPSSLVREYMKKEE